MKHRSFVLLAVLVIVGSSLLVVTGMIFLAQSETAGRHVSRERAERGVMVHSALNVIVRRLDQQRDQILDGRVPELDEQYELYESGTRLVVARLLPLREGGLRIEPEAGKLDLNEVDADQLVAMELFDMQRAEAIVTFREQSLGRPFQSVVELLHVDGVTPEMVYGPLESLTVDQQRDGTRDRLPLVRESISGAVDFLTVFSFEPALQRDGRQRINLNVDWSDELAGRLDDRFGDGASQIIKGIVDAGTSFDDETVIFSVLNQFDVPPEDWPDIIDTITTEEGDYHFGRLDINTASEEALLALPTIEPEQAREIVQLRDGLSDDEQATVAWPLLRDVLDRGQYEALGGKITTRSWTYRIRFAVGEVDADAPDEPMQAMMICEAVIDLSAPKPRVAYLRDVTMLGLAARIVVADGLGDEDDPDALSEQSEFISIDGEWPNDDSASDEAEDDWFDVDWEIGELGGIEDPMVDETAGDQAEHPNDAPTRRRIGRWRGN